VTSGGQARKPVLSPGTLLFLRIWLGVVTVITIVMAVLAIRELVDPSSDGQPGTVIITSCNSDYASRRCYGNFTANSGGLTLTNTQVYGEGHGSVGAVLHTYGDSANRTVAVVSGEETFTDIYIAAALLVIWAGMFYFLVYRPVKRRRLARRLPTGSEPPAES
jgi:uncharacterized membrane protein